MAEVIPPDVLVAVAARDNYRCVAPRLDPDAGPCRNRWGATIVRWPLGIDRTKVTYAHVKDADRLSMGKKAPSDERHLLLLCWGHHIGSIAGATWGTSKHGLELQREYLAR